MPAPADSSLLLERMLAPGSLRWAWQRVRENKGAAGADGISLKRFGHMLDSQLLALEEEVRASTYQPGRYRRTTIHTRGKSRPIVIIPVRDRVLQRAAVEVLSPIAEKRFLSCSFGYRPGRSVADAIEDVVCVRDKGLTWVVDADIRACFDRLDHAILREVVAGLVPEPVLRDLINRWIVGPPRQRGIYPAVGIPQGAVISPLLCNLYLHQFDTRIKRRRYHLVRYADDFVILCKSRQHAERALRDVEKILASLRLELNPIKTGITSFDEGFTFLGVHFQDNEYRYQVEGRQFVVGEGNLPDWFYEHPEDHYRG